MPETVVIDLQTHRTEAANEHWHGLLSRCPDVAHSALG